MSARLRTSHLVLGLSLAMCLAVAALSAQRGGGGGGGGGLSQNQNRLAVLTAALTLDESQKDQAKTALDAEFKSAAPLRKALAAARETLGAAIQAGKDPEIDRAVAAYATQVTAMAGAEMQALAKIVRTLTPEQQANTAAVQTAASLMRGAFIGKKWDTVPDVRFY